jgi:hypothetical protein
MVDYDLDYIAHFFAHMYILFTRADTVISLNHIMGNINRSGMRYNAKQS